MNAQRPLLISNDPDLIDDVLRLAAANSVELHLAADAEAARTRWQLAPMVLVGADAGLHVASARMTRRRDVVLVAREPSADTWQNAVALGAEHVAALPEAERWLIDRLADCGEGPARDGRVVAVMGSGAGAGASTFAVTLALSAARMMRTLIVDADPLGGGLDILLGIEEVPGVRWADLADTRGRLGINSLEQALPAHGGLPVLSWGRSGPTTLSIEAGSAVMDAAARGFDLVIVDLPRHLDAMAELVLSRADVTLVVTSNRVRSTAAAARLIDQLDGRSGSIRLAVRMDPKGLRDDAVQAALGVPVVAHLPVVANLPTRADDGEPPTVSDRYGKACAAALREIVGGTDRAA